MDKVIERLKTEFSSEDARYAYADSVTDAFLTAQIKTLREERGLTQEKLAELVGTKQSGISRWQNTGYSSCKVDTLRKFARGLGVRLRITLEEFGSLPTDVGGFTKERLAPRRFEDDPAFKEPPVKEPALEEVFVRVGQAVKNEQRAATRIGTLQRLGSGEVGDDDLSWMGNSCEVANRIAADYPRGTTLRELGGYPASHTGLGRPNRTLFLVPRANVTGQDQKRMDYARAFTKRQKLA